jgi:short-subunit dehydrogenase
LPEQVIRRFRAVDGLINYAGIIQPFCLLKDLDYSTIERVVNVYLLGTLFCTKTFLPRLLERPEAHIVNVSSMGGFVPVPGQTMYCAAKAAVKLMSEELASELLEIWVRVSVVFPGTVATKIRENSGVSSPQASEGSGETRALPAKETASIIVRGIERHTRIFVGRDASMMDKLYRLNPDYAARAIAIVTALNSIDHPHLTDLFSNLRVTRLQGQREQLLRKLRQVSQQQCSHASTVSWFWFDARSACPSFAELPPMFVSGILPALSATRQLDGKGAIHPWTNSSINGLPNRLKTAASLTHRDRISYDMFE